MFAQSKVLILSDVLETRKMDEHKNLSEFEEQRLALDELLLLKLPKKLMLVVRKMPEFTVNHGLFPPTSPL